MTAREWHPIEGDIPWMQTWLTDDSRQGNGFWAVEIVQDGLYSFTLRRYPRGVDLPLGVTQVQLKLNDREEKITVSESDTEATVQWQLEAGQAFLQTWLIDEMTDIERGAYFVYVELLS
ncbi:MAG: hypothetical protein AAF629_36975 [Chloroflexota bacterium]